MADPQVQLQLTAENQELIQRLEESSAAMQKFGSNVLQMAVGFTTVQGAVDRAMGAVIGKIKEAVDYIPNCIESTGKLGEEFKELHITAGMTTEDFNKYAATIELSGGKTEDLTAIVDGMEKGIKRNSAVLVENGIAVNKNALSHMDLGQYITAVVDKMDHFESASDKDQLAMAAFGRGGMAFVSVLKEMRDNLKEGAEVAANSNIVDMNTVHELEELTKAKARAADAEKRWASAVSAATVEADIAIQNSIAANKNYLADQLLVDKLIAEGKIKDENVMISWTDGCERDYDKLIKKAKEYLAVQQELDQSYQKLKASGETPDNDVGTNKNVSKSKPKETFKGPDVLEEEKKAKEKAAQEAKEKAREAARQKKADAEEAHRDAMEMIRADEAAEKAAAKETVELNHLALEDTVANDRMELSIKKADLEADFNNGKITRQQKLEADKALVEAEDRLAVSAMAKSIRDDNLTLVEQRKLENQILETHRRTMLAKKKLDDDETQEVRANTEKQRQAYEHMFESMTSGFNSTAVSMIMDGQTVNNGLKSIGKDIARTVLTAGLHNIEVSAGKAGAAAMADHYSMGDVWGAIPAGIAAFAKGMSFQSLISASASQGYDIPAGINPVVQTHAEEMILPKNLANKVRNMTNNGDGGGVHYHTHLEGSTIAGSGLESGRIIGRVVNQHQQSYDKKHG